MSDTKNYLIIGGNSDIGKSLSDLLQAKNYSVTLASRRGTSDSNAKTPLYDATRDKLKSEKIPSITGHILHVDGGLSALLV